PFGGIVEKAWPILNSSDHMKILGSWIGSNSSRLNRDLMMSTLKKSCSFFHSLNLNV
ncbi:Hypothetical protein FKW44_000201, partial [Caligus rogercresseyi]